MIDGSEEDANNALIKTDRPQEVRGKGGITPLEKPPGEAGGMYTGLGDLLAYGDYWVMYAH